MALRDTLREVPTTERCGLVRRFDELTALRVAPLVDDTQAVDRHRLAEMKACSRGEPYRTDDIGWNLSVALRRAAPHDPELFRGYLAVTQLLERGVDVLGRPGLAERAVALAGGDPPAPDREQLLALAARP